jgi:response regulator of citrate/malate metabolism
VNGMQFHGASSTSAKERRMFVEQTPPAQNASAPTNINMQLPLAGRALHILVVDDDSMMRQLMTAMIQQLKMNATAAVDGYDAQQKIAVNNYDLVIADILMPRLDGISLLKWIKEQNTGLEVILFSGAHDLDHVLQALRLGALDYLHKPFKFEDLRESIRRYLLKRNRLEQSSQSRCEQALVLVRQAMHDVRGGLVNLTGLVKTLEKKNSRSDSRARENPIDKITGQFNRLINLTENYCSQAVILARDEALAEEDLDLHEDVIAYVIDSLAQEIEEKRISFKRHPLTGERVMKIKANNLFIRSVFRNLFDNAIKYSPKNGIVSYAIENNGNNFRIVIENDDDVFSLSAVESAGSRPTGLGLGLSMTKNFVRRCGGDIWSEPKENGTRILLTLPVFS